MQKDVKTINHFANKKNSQCRNSICWGWIVWSYRLWLLSHLMEIFISYNLFLWHMQRKRQLFVTCKRKSWKNNLFTYAIMAAWNMISYKIVKYLQFSLHLSFCCLFIYIPLYNNNRNYIINTNFKYFDNYVNWSIKLLNIFYFTKILTEWFVSIII